MIRRRVKNEDIILFFAELERMARSNVAWQDGLKELTLRETGTMSQLCAAVVERLRRGDPLSEALRSSAVLSPYAIALLKSGEQGGAMADALRDAALMYRRMQISRQVWKSAARYPLVVFVLFCAVMVFISYQVLPKIEDVYTGVYIPMGAIELPWPTHMVLVLARFIREYILIMLGSLILLVYLLNALWRTPKGRLFFSNVAQIIPGLGRALFYDSAGRFCRALGILLERRVTADAAVMLAAGTAETMLSKKLAGRMCERLRLGGALWEGVADSYVLPPSMVWLIQKAEEHGDAAGVFLQIADLYDDKFTNLNAKIIELIEPVLLVLVGLVIMFVAIALFMPFYMIPMSHLG